MTTLVIVLVVVVAILAVLCLVGFVMGLCDEADRQAEVARINRERRQAEARNNQVTTAALRQMVDAATPHGQFCGCARCAGRGGER